MDDARTVVMMPPARVLAAVDFSEGSRRALSFAAPLARHCDGELHVVHAPLRLLHTPALERGTEITAGISGGRLAARLHTRLLLVHVIPRTQIPSRAGDFESTAQRDAVRAKARLEPLVAALRRIAPVEVRIEIGSIVPALVHATDDLPGALLVLGRAVHAHVDGVPGAIASRVLAHTHVPLLLAMPST